MWVSIQHIMSSIQNMSAYHFIEGISFVTFKDQKALPSEFYTPRLLA